MQPDMSIDHVLISGLLMGFMAGVIFATIIGLLAIHNWKKRWV